MIKLNISIKPTEGLWTSNWAFDPIFLEPGESATIVECIVAHPTNPMYAVRRDRDGETHALHRNLLVKCGALEAIK